MRPLMTSTVALAICAGASFGVAIGSGILLGRMARTTWKDRRRA